MTNAIKFSFKGSAIDIIADQNQDLVSLSIIDKGIGMPKKIENDIFNIEKSISRPGTEGEVGTGFGMPLVKKFVEAYGGTIQIISKEKSADENDHGTKAVVTLPAK
ncbi:MAG: ATP-binding protein, partial [Desulfobacterales bacterium]|nr:ATP-binding protein [Desulfobacterales bacterium]